MGENNGRTGGQIAINAARAGKALANIMKSAAAGGVQGAAVAAAKEFVPELVKLAIGIMIVLIVIPIVVMSAVPNIFFGFKSSSVPEVSSMTGKAADIGSTYFNIEQFEDTEIDSVVTSIASDYAENGAEIEEIIVENDFTEEDLLWLIAISSVSNEQDLNIMSTGGVQQMSASRLLYDDRLEGTTLTVTITRIEPETWMEQLGFTDEAKTWTRALHETILKSSVLEKYADQYETTRPSYSGDTGYSGSYERGEDYDNMIDISGFTHPETKNAHDLAAYAIQAWENGWGYVWGSYGNVLTPALFEYKLRQYPDGVGNYESFIRENWLGRRTADCIGLIKGYGWLDAETLTIQYGTNGMPDYGANQMHSSAIQSGLAHGSIATIPEIPGLGLWKNGHAGVYIGGGYAIEAMGTKYGVVKTEVAGRGWEEWYEIPSIEY